MRTLTTVVEVLGAEGADYRSYCDRDESQSAFPGIQFVNVLEDDRIRLYEHFLLRCETWKNWYCTP
jgi:hypothetical protein